MSEDIEIISYRQAGKKIASRVKLGSYSFTNCLPINYPLKELPIDNLDISYSTPSETNKELLEGNLDVALISTAFYLEHKNKFVFLKDLSISSNYDVGSVLLFSKYDIEDLGNKKIYVSHMSYTSVKLLKLILIEYTGKYPDIKWSSEDSSISEILEIYDAALLIGDQAIKNNYSQNLTANCKVYDLGKLWFSITGYPMVYAVWAVGKRYFDENEVLVGNLNELLIRAKDLGLGLFLNQVISLASERLDISVDSAKDYLCNKLNYGINDKIIKSLEIFNLNLIKNNL